MTRAAKVRFAIPALFFSLALALSLAVPAIALPDQAQGQGENQGQGHGSGNNQGQGHGSGNNQGQNGGQGQDSDEDESSNGAGNMVWICKYVQTPGGEERSAQRVNENALNNGEFADAHRTEVINGPEECGGSGDEDSDDSADDGADDTSSDDTSNDDTSNDDSSDDGVTEDDDGASTEDLDANTTVQAAAVCIDDDHFLSITVGGDEWDTGTLSITGLDNQVVDRGQELPQVAWPVDGDGLLLDPVDVTLIVDGESNVTVQVAVDEDCGADVEGIFEEDDGNGDDTATDDRDEEQRGSDDTDAADDTAVAGESEDRDGSGLERAEQASSMDALPRTGLSTFTYLLIGLSSMLAGGALLRRRPTV